jgi:hypothetical protein
LEESQGLALCQKLVKHPAYQHHILLFKHGVKTKSGNSWSVSPSRLKFVLGEVKAQGIAQGIHRGMNFSTQSTSTFAATNRFLSWLPLPPSHWRWWGADDGGVNHRISVVGIVRCAQTIVPTPSFDLQRVVWRETTWKSPNLGW